MVKILVLQFQLKDLFGLQMYTLVTLAHMWTQNFLGTRFKVKTNNYVHKIFWCEVQIKLYINIFERLSPTFFFTHTNFSPIESFEVWSLPALSSSSIPEILAMAFAWKASHGHMASLNRQEQTCLKSLSYYFLMTFSWLCYDFLMAFSWHAHDFLITL